MSRVMRRKSAFSIYKNEDTDKLHGNCTADQCLCFHYIGSTIPQLPKFQAIFCNCTAQIVSDLVGNPKTGFFMTWLKLLESFIDSNRLDASYLYLRVAKKVKLE